MDRTRVTFRELLLRYGVGVPEPMSSEARMRDLLMIGVGIALQKAVSSNAIEPVQAAVFSTYALRQPTDSLYSMWQPAEIN